MSWATRTRPCHARSADAWAEKSIWKREFHANAKAWVVHDDAVGVMTPDGKFALLILTDGKAIVDEKLDAEPNLSEIYVLRSPDQYILATNRPTQVRNNINRQSVTGAIGNPLITRATYTSSSVRRAKRSAPWRSIGRGCCSASRLRSRC